jgi:hypothetical protein
MHIVVVQGAFVLSEIVCEIEIVCGTEFRKKFIQVLLKVVFL